MMRGLRRETSEDVQPTRYDRRLGHFEQLDQDFPPKIVTFPNRSTPETERNGLPAWIYQSEQEILQQLVQEISHDPKEVIATTDLDDVFWTTNALWASTLENAYVEQERAKGRDIQPRPVEEIFRTGGVTFIRTFIPLLGQEKYDRIVHELFHGQKSNGDLPAIEPEIAKWSQQHLDDRRIQVVAGLTARPDTTDVRTHTYHLLQRDGLLNTQPVLFRPTDIEWGIGSDEWKVRVIEHLRRAVPHAGILHIDDKLDQALEIHRWNEKNAGRLNGNGKTNGNGRAGRAEPHALPQVEQPEHLAPIAAIVFEAELTRIRMQSEVEWLEQRPWIYFAKNWKEMDRAVDEYLQDWEAYKAGQPVKDEVR